MKRIIEIDESLYNRVKEKIVSLSDIPCLCKAVDESKPCEERPQGEWITVHFIPDELNAPEKSKFDFVKCPFCETIHQGRHNFCSRCGADMRSESEANNEQRFNKP